LATEWTEIYGFPCQHMMRINRSNNILYIVILRMLFALVFMY